ncbi:MAG: hypothetical protein OEO20_01200 [Gemmatimonadota bacterium]|nr:hypothetical protein [Gemmatimonadota bacterium]MDH3476903.1 hypothetical protein [Gemmatimonadota bacterium]MDH3568586.1 hypothetical protein [Gemmatimonadota bacterium]MDH5548293.1 hypothetical protein [Gemmatimonadota bacterium]
MLALELPTVHRIPVTWLRQHACVPIRWRTVHEILPSGSASPADVDLLREELLQYKRVTQTTRKQKTTGIWGKNILGLAASKAQSINDVGTVAQYRHLVELGLPSDDRALRLAERPLFRLLSRDSDPALLFEYQKGAKTNPALGLWAREFLREGATAALAHAGHSEDPRVRGAAHRIATNISRHLRSELSEKPIVRKGARNMLHPEACPPSLFAVAIIAYMPSMLRERAGFVDRLGHYLAQTATKRAWVIQVGRKAITPTYHFLGDPLKADSAGNPKDLPFALHWIELLVRMGVLETSGTAQRILARLYRDCDADGVWSPKNLRSIPRSSSKLGDFAFPLELDGKTSERRRADVTFRLALIAKLAGWETEYI